MDGTDKRSWCIFHQLRGGASSKAAVTVDWFHIVQTFTKRLDEVRKKARREQPHAKSLRWTLLTNARLMAR